MTHAEKPENRRPIKAREKAWAHWLAHFFVARGVTPNQMSAASAGCAAVGALAYLCIGSSQGWWRGICLFAAALFIQLRLVANLLDGMMALEEGKKTPTGALYNEFPDRIADTLFLVGAGYATLWPWLGWCAALLAIATAYIRAFGGGLGFAQDYSGPMAKQHRMFTLTIGSIVAALLPGAPFLALALVIIIIGGGVTVVRRTLHIARQLEQAP